MTYYIHFNSFNKKITESNIITSLKTHEPFTLIIYKKLKHNGFATLNRFL